MPGFSVLPCLLCSCIWCYPICLLPSHVFIIKKITPKSFFFISHFQRELFIQENLKLFGISTRNSTLSCVFLLRHMIKYNCGKDSYKPWNTTERLFPGVISAHFGTNWIVFSFGFLLFSFLPWSVHCDLLNQNTIWTLA